MTASNFGKVLNRKRQPTEKFLDNIFSQKEITATPLEYGKRNEPKAKAKYLEKFKSRHLHECGLVVNKEISFLGASPDGKVCSEGITGLIEVKCPYTARDMNISEAIEQIKDFMLKKHEDVINLDQMHNNYAQVQGQLMVSGSPFCDFVVYTNNDLYVERIYPNKDYMEKMLSKLCTFYADYVKPYIEAKKSPEP